MLTLQLNDLFLAPNMFFQQNVKKSIKTFLRHHVDGEK